MDKKFMSQTMDGQQVKQTIIGKTRSNRIHKRTGNNGDTYFTVKEQRKHTCNRRTARTTTEQTKPKSNWSEWVKVALRPSNAKRLYMDEKSTERGEAN